VTSVRTRNGRAAESYPQISRESAHSRLLVAFAQRVPACRGIAARRRLSLRRESSPHLVVCLGSLRGPAKAARTSEACRTEGRAKCSLIASAGAFVGCQRHSLASLNRGWLAEATALDPSPPIVVDRARLPRSDQYRVLVMTFHIPLGFLALTLTSVYQGGCYVFQARIDTVG
jgi:hypothetical protein